MDIGPDLGPATNNYPGINAGDEGNYHVDITNVYYVLSIPDIWIIPREKYVSLGNSK